MSEVREKPTCGSGYCQNRFLPVDPTTQLLGSVHPGVIVPARKTSTYIQSGEAIVSTHRCLSHASADTFENHPFPSSSISVIFILFIPASFLFHCWGLKPITLFNRVGAHSSSVADTSSLCTRTHFNLVQF